MAPGLTWANFGADGGDLIAAAATGGVAHPTGYPLYLLLARLFQFLPIGSLAFRTSLMSGVATALAAVLVYKLVVRNLSLIQFAPLLACRTGFRGSLRTGTFGLVSGSDHGSLCFAIAACCASSLHIGYSFICAFHAYSQGLFIRAHIWSGNGEPRYYDLPPAGNISYSSAPYISSAIRETLAGYLAGGRPLRIASAALAGRRIIGLSYSALASFFSSTHQLGQSSYGGWLAWLVSGRLYQGQLLSLSIPFVMQRFAVIAVQYLAQFGILGLSIGLTGLIVFFKPARLYLNMLWIVAASSIFTLVYATADAFIYLIPALLCFAIWIGMGVGRIMDIFPRRFYRLEPLIGLVCILALLVQAWGAWPKVDASHDQRAESFGKAVLSLAPARAIVFANGDQAIFSLWYFHYALQNRPDLAIVATDLLQFTWYLENLRSTYPDLNLPGPFPFPETVVVANPERPVCYVAYLQAPEINCLPVRVSQR